MADCIVPTDEELKAINLQDAETKELIRFAEESARRDHQLTVWEALK